MTTKHHGGTVAGRVANVIRGARDREVMYKVRQSTDVMSNRCSSARPVLPGWPLRTLMGYL